MPLQAQSAQRREFTAAASVLTAARTLSLEETGAWQEIINRAVFSIFRGAELYRGEISIRLTENENVSLRFLPGGIFELSTGLLDFIDSSILDSGDISSRRLRQLDLERERMLLPFIAAEAGIFAADAEFRAYRRIAAESGAGIAREAASGARTFVFDMEETLQADICAEAILYAAGEFTPYSEWLKEIFTDEAENPELKDYIARFPEYKSRAAALEEELADPLNGVQQLKLVLNSLKTGFNITGALVAAENLGNKLPGTVYIDRLKALLAHRAWEESLAESAGGTGAAALSMLPLSQPLETERSSALKSLAEGMQDGSALFGFLPRAQVDWEARTERFYRQALEAYANVAAAYSDFTIQSARAFLAAQKATDEELAGIIADAAEAALMEAGTSSILARTNYARLLYLTGQDLALSIRIMEGIFPQAEAAGNAQIPSKESLYSYISPGFPGDSRLALLFYAEAAAYSGDKDTAGRAIAVVMADPVEEGEGEGEKNTLPGENTILRSIALGDDSETVEDMWGQPGEIAFSTESETWAYPEIMAEAVFVPLPQFDAETGLSAGITRVLVAIGLCTGSPVSFPGDLRCGDSIQAFEEVLGTPAYRADDFLVYFYDGIRVKLRAARDGTVRSFFICF